MWCVNPMVVNSWKDPYSGYEDCQGGSGEAEDEVADEIPTQPPRPPTTLLSRSASCNRINLALPNRKAKRSLSTSGRSRPPVPTNRSDRPSSTSSDKPVEVESPKERGGSVIARLARQYSFSRSRRSSSNSMNSIQTQEGTMKGKSPRRRRNKDSSKKDAKKMANHTENRASPNHLELPKQKMGRIPSPLQMTLINSHIDGDFGSSAESCPNSPPHFQNVFPSPPASPSRLAGVPTIGGRVSPKNPAASNTTHGLRMTNSPTSADDSPIPSPPLDDKSYDSGRMSMSSFRSFGSGRPTSLSSVTSSISSRTSRGSDYFSSASSTGQPDQQHQVTSYRLGLQTVLPDLNESDSVDRLVLDSEPGEDKTNVNGEVTSSQVERQNGQTDDTSSNSQQRKKSDVDNARAAAFAAHARNSKDLNSVDHLSPVANLAMVANPDLSYVDRVILELLETERMYVRSLRDILTGYLAVIRSTRDLKIQQDDVDDLFGNIRDIYDFNRNLLRELEDCYGDPARVAQCFVSKNEDFRVYTEYCTNYPSSVAAMTRCMRSQNLADFFKLQQDELRHTLPLGSYLLKPVQRILKYHLLLQELVKHCDKEEEGYPVIQVALQTMTRVARHINDMKRKHEDAVHIQEIQSLLTNWQGNELATYGELIMENEMRMQGAKNERQVFLFEKMILITKRREDGYLVCKVNIVCSNLVLLESLPNNPMGFQIQPYAENLPCMNVVVKQVNNGPPEPPRPQRYTLLAPSLEEKNLWTYHIKRLIIDTMLAAVPLKAKKSIMRMKARREGDGDESSENEPIKEKPRFGSNPLHVNQDSKSSKSSLARFGTSHSASNILSGVSGSKKVSVTAGSAPQSKPRRRSDSISRKSVHKRALRRKDDGESSDDISSDSIQTTPAGVKVPGKFSFPGFRQSTRSSSVQQTNPKTTTAQSKPVSEAVSTVNSKQTTTSATKQATKPAQSKVAKPHHQSVVYRRHKRRTSQPITIIEKRLSMKLPDEEGENGIANSGPGDKQGVANMEDDLDDLMNFNPLTARESVSWDIQIVEAVFERYKKESSVSPPTPMGNTDDESLGSTYLTVPSGIAPSPLLSLDHTPILSQRRKSRIVVVPSSDTSDEERERTKSNSNNSSAVIRRKKDKNGRGAYRTSGVVYNLPQKEKEVESDSGVNESKTYLRKIAQASESVRKSMVIHESDTDAETNRILKEKAVTARRKSSIKRRERNLRKRANSGNNSIKTSTESLSMVNPGDKPETTVSEIVLPSTVNRRGSFYDNVSSEDVTVMTSKAEDGDKNVTNVVTVTCSTKHTQSSTTSVVTVQSSSLVSTTTTCSRSGDVISLNCNNNNNIQNIPSMVGKRESPIPTNVNKDTKNIPTGKVRGLIEKLKSVKIEEPKVNGVTSPLRRTPITSPTFRSSKGRFSFDSSTSNDQSISGSMSPISWMDHKAPPSPQCKTQGTPKIPLKAVKPVNRPTQGKKMNPTLEMDQENLTNDVLEIKEENDHPAKKLTSDRPSLSTTGSLPLDLTSSSSSENESNPTIAQRVKRLSMGEAEVSPLNNEEDINDSKKKSVQPCLFLRRTFSKDENSNTRRSTNLSLEARISGEYAQANADESTDMLFQGVSDTENVFSKKKDNQVPATSDPKFAKDESLNDAKHYLFEKLCLTTPAESKVTDKMSEDFEDVCSALENNLRYSSIESHPFSASDEETIATRMGKNFLRGDLSPRGPRRASNKTKEDSLENHSKSKDEDVNHEHPKIIGSKTTPEQNNYQRRSQQHGQPILPNRSDSIRSTRSEYASRYTPRTSSRFSSLESESGRRGRSLTQRSRNSFCNRLPSKDMQAIPQKNVSKLTKQFSEIGKQSEKLAHNPPRRSKSVGVSSRMKHKLQTHQQQKDKEFSAAPKRTSFTRSMSTSKMDKSTELSSTASEEKTTNKSNANRPVDKSKLEKRYPFQTAAVKVDEELTCKTVSRSVTVLHSTDGNDDNDDVFENLTKSSPPEVSPVRPEVNTCVPKIKISEESSESLKDAPQKMMSFVEMFAANPQNCEDKKLKKEGNSENSEDDSEEILKEISEIVPKNNLHAIFPYDSHRQSPQVKVILVQGSENAKGARTLEPRVLNLDVVRNDKNSENFLKSPNSEKRHSWANRPGSNTELAVRTRLRSSSFSKSKRKGLLFAESSKLKDTSSNENGWIEQILQTKTTNVK